MVEFAVINLLANIASIINSPPWESFGPIFASLDHSTAGGKEGLECFFTLFATCRREGGRAKQRPGESPQHAEFAQVVFKNSPNNITGKQISGIAVLNNYDITYTFRLLE